MCPGQALGRYFHANSSRKYGPGFSRKERFSAFRYRLRAGVRVRGKDGILPSDVKTYRNLTEADVIEEGKGPERIYFLITSGKELIIINMSFTV